LTNPDHTRTQRRGKYLLEKAIYLVMIKKKRGGGEKPLKII
jgi:hypothetical protein